jgi:hypothetical protein
MSEPVAPDEYYRAIEEEFLRRRGAPLLLSPRDWGLIGEWRSAGVPLRIALQAIANVFESFQRRGPGHRRINSLSYCRQEVLALHDLYRSLRGAAAGRPDAGAGGGAAPDPARVVSRHLGRLARRLREALAHASASGHDALVAAAARAAADLKGIRREIKSGTFEPSRLEEALRRLDESLLAAARRALPGGEAREIESAAERQLAETRDRMTPAAYESTRAALLGRLLRERLRLPRLTLFE